MLLRLVVLLFTCNLLCITVLISFPVGKYAVDDGCCGHVRRALQLPAYNTQRSALPRLFSRILQTVLKNARIQSHDQ